MRIYLIISACLFLSCSKQYSEPNSIQLLGHGGMGFDYVNADFAPNTMGSFKQCLNIYNLDGIEVDIQFTKDAKIIVYHDEYLESSTQCIGRINDVNWIDIRGCTFRGMYRNTFDNEVVTLDSLISHINKEWRNKRVSLNVQSRFEIPFPIETIVDTFLTCIQKITDLERVNVECKNLPFLDLLQKNSVVSCWYIADIDQNIVSTLEQYELDGVVSRFTSRNESIEMELNQRGKKIMLYGQRIAPNYSDYTYTYIDALQVDNPVLALRFLGRKN